MIKKNNKMIKEIDEKVKRMQEEERRVRIREMEEMWQYDRDYSIQKAELKGVKIGKKEGIKEAAKKMLMLNMSKEVIMQVTGLNVKDLNSIKV